MKAYQDGIAKFEEQGAQVIAVTTDKQPAVDYWAQKVLEVKFPIAGDALGKVAADYGVLTPGNPYPMRSTFVIDPDGMITYIEQGNTAIDPTGATTACSRSKHTN